MSLSIEDLKLTTHQLEINRPRSEWLRLWSVLPPGRVKSVAEGFAQRYRIEDLGVSPSGLGLLPLRDSALGEPYFLGEIPLARAHVRIADDADMVAEGAAVLLDDRASLTRAMAILDGVLAARLPGFEPILALLEEGSRAVDEIAAGRRALLAATRVDFSLLGLADEEDEYA
jgi:alpha-D-ribose 1-methylphosphonate 5-triphosphate synthase subunit PhnG